MVLVPKVILLASCVIGVVTGLVSIESIDSLTGKILIGFLFGAGVGLMAFNDKSDEFVSSIIGAAVALIYMTGFILFYFLSSTASVGVLLIGVIISATMYYSVSKI